MTEIRQLTRSRTPPLEVNSESNTLVQTPYNRGKLVQMVQDIQGTPSHVSHTRRRKGRKVIKYTDSILVAFAHEKAQKHQLEAEVEATKQPKRRRVTRHPDEVYITREQILAHTEGVDTIVAEDLETEVAHNAQVERFMIKAI